MLAVGQPSSTPRRRRGAVRSLGARHARRSARPDGTLRGEGRFRTLRAAAFDEQASHGEGESTMARIRHIALQAEDTAKLAEFYKTTFGLHEVGRLTVADGRTAVFVSDGHINLA